jgi:hypothetical protein
MYSSEYTSGFSGPAASHLAPLIRLVTKTMSDRLLPILKAITKNFSTLAAQAAGTSIAPSLHKRPSGAATQRET